MFEFPVVCYLFLGGVGGGVCAVASGLALSVPARMLRGPVRREYRSLLGSAFALAAAVLVLGALCLIADGVRVEALEHLFFPSRPTLLSAGSWAITAGIVLSGVLAMWWRTGGFGALESSEGLGPAARLLRSVAVLRAMLVLGTLIGLAIVLYTGVFLASMSAVALWDTWWLPALFTVSALSCGAVVVTAIARISGTDRAFPGAMTALVRVDVAVITLEAVCAVGFVAAALADPSETSAALSAQSSANDLIAGERAWLWWACFVGCGIVAAAALDLAALVSRRRAYARGGQRAVCRASVANHAVPLAACVLVGAFALRLCVVAAGAHPVMSLL